MDRRTTIKWTLAAGIAAAAGVPLTGTASGATTPVGPATGAHGYGTDPDLTATYRPGELWPLTLSATQRRLAAVLADVIIPADERSQSASAVGVVDFIDEWVSAPYPAGRRDRPVILDGLAWLDAEAVRRHGRSFAELHASEQHAICNEICDESRAAPERREAAHFFAVYRNLTAGGFYSTPVGRKDIGYIGNVASASFGGPPAQLIEKLGLN
jgi:gluconate 2-dehydrogenase subunit 3-like protein